jgi:uncharacterized protein YggU (UPF0235/DUF167 family)
MDATRVRLRVAPGSARSAVVGRYGDGWKLRVAAAPERGRANAAVVELLTEALGVSRDDVEIVAGLGARDKVAALRGLSQAEAARRLDAATVGGAGHVG